MIHENLYDNCLFKSLPNDGSSVVMATVTKKIIYLVRGYVCIYLYNINIKIDILGNEKLTGTVIHSARLLNNRFSFASTTKCLQNFLCSRLCPSTRPTCVGASSVLPFIPLTINCGVLSENLADFNNCNETEIMFCIKSILYICTYHKFDMFYDRIDRLDYA